MEPGAVHADAQGALHDLGSGGHDSPRRPADRDHVLAPGHLVPGRRPRRRDAQMQRHDDRVLPPHPRHVHRQPVRAGLSGSDVGVDDAGGHHRALASDRHARLVGRRRGEQHPARDRDLGRRDLDDEGLVQLLHLLRLGREGAVGEDDPVPAEVVVVRGLAVVAAVAEVLVAVPVPHPDRLVCEVPDEPALEQLVAVCEVDVLRHPAERVAHRVRVLAEDERLVPVLAQLLLHRGGRRVHLARDVGGLGVARIPGHALVVDGSVIRLAEPVGHVPQHRAAVRLVAARPDHDARVVAVALEHAARTVQSRRSPLVVVAGDGDVLRRAALADLGPAPVRLHVHLVDDEQPVLIGQLVEHGVVRVVAGAHGVDVVSLQHPHVGLGHLPRRDAARQGELVTVDAVEHDAHAVEREHAVLDSEAADADALRDHLGQGPLGIPHLDDQLVQVRVLRAPQTRILDVQHQGAVPAGGQLAEFGDARRGRSFARELHVQLDVGGCQIVGHHGPHAQVLGVHGGAAVQHDVAEDAGEAEEVLILQPRSGAVGEDLRCEAVLALDQGIRQVELPGREPVGAVPDVPPVQPYRDRALGAVEAHAQALTGLQRGVQRERADIASDRVVALGHLTGDDVLLTVPRVPHVDVLGAVVALQLQVRRHPDRVPGRDVVPRVGEVRRRLPLIACAVERPAPVEGLLEGADAGADLVGVAEPAVIGVRRQAVLRDEARVGDAVDVEGGIDGHVVAPLLGCHQNDNVNILRRHPGRLRARGPRRSADPRARSDASPGGRETDAGQPAASSGRSCTSIAAVSGE